MVAVLPELLLVQAVHRAQDMVLVKVSDLVDHRSMNQSNLVSTGMILTLVDWLTNRSLDWCLWWSVAL